MVKSSYSSTTYEVNAIAGGALEPRLPESDKWTPFPAEFTAQIEEVFSQTYADFIGEGFFTVEGQIYVSEILLRVGWVKPNQLAQVNFEVSVDYDFKTQKTQDRIALAVDAAGAWFDQHFAPEGETDVTTYPLLWESFDLDKEELFVKYSSVNTRLEAMANGLLGNRADDALVVADRESSEDAMDKAIVDSELAEEVQTKIRGGFKIH